MAGPKRNIYRYAGCAGYLLQLAPRSFAWRRLVWCRYRPWAEGFVGYRAWRWVRFAIVNPRMWWLSLRIELHLRLGFPMPRVRGYNAVEL